MQKIALKTIKDFPFKAKNRAARKKQDSQNTGSENAHKARETGKKCRQSGKTRIRHKMKQFTYFTEKKQQKTAKTQTIYTRNNILGEVF